MDGTELLVRPRVALCNVRAAWRVNVDRGRVYLSLLEIVGKRRLVWWHVFPEIVGDGSVLPKI